MMCGANNFLAIFCNKILQIFKFDGQKLSLKHQLELEAEVYSMQIGSYMDEIIKYQIIIVTQQ